MSCHLVVVVVVVNNINGSYSNRKHSNVSDYDVPGSMVMVLHGLYQFNNFMKYIIILTLQMIELNFRNIT